ncbi:MAG: response regulator, partial [Bacteriovoracaceae bacterium]
AGDGVQAIELYEREKENLGIIISDLGMPNMDGRELMRELLARNATVRFIFITGYLDKDSKNELFEMGARDVLLKPFTSEGVLETVHRVSESLYAV